MWRVMAWGGALGPLAFIGAWAVGGVVTSRSYSPVEDTISQLAAVGAPTRALMTGGMLAFGVAVPVSAAAMRRALPGSAWISAAVAGVATIGVAATPLDRSGLVDGLHAVAAGVGYVALTAVPLLAFRPLSAAGHRTLARFGVLMSVVAALALPTSLVVDQTGLFQRIGLSAGDAFLIASAPVVARLAHRRS